MTRYEHEYDFLQALPDLIKTGATLRELYDAMLRVQDEDMRQVGTTPGLLRALATHWSQRPRFIPIRLNELFGGLQVEHDDDYVLAMIGALGDRWQAGIREHFLRHDHALRDEVFWRIFEVEGGGEVSLANVDKLSGHVGAGADARRGLGWHATVLALAADGTLDRARLLRGCLQALNRDFSAYRAGWFSRLYDALAPSAAEAAADQDLLLLALGTTVTANVSLAAKQLAAVHKAGLLDAPAFVAACAPALTGPKAAALGVLKMLAAIASKKQADLDATAQALALGMGHAHPDVQRAAAAALLKLDRADLVRANASLLAPAVAAECLPKDAAAPVVPDAPDAPDAATPPASPTPLPPAAPPRPWTDADARERCAALLEDASDAIEFELMLAWLASADNPGAALAPLVKRARKLVERSGHYPAALTLAACVPGFKFFPRQPKQPTEEESSPLPSLVTRLREVAAVLQGRAPRRPLLATPTSGHGWIAPAAFRDRLAAHQNTAPFPADLTQALLRLHPEGRDAVLAASGLTMPPVTAQIRIAWHSHGSDIKKPNGEPRWVWWYPVVTPAADDADEDSPAVIPPQSEDDRKIGDWVDLLTCAEIGWIHPPSTTMLVALCIGLMNDETNGTEVVYGVEHVLPVLSRHPGAWSAETAQLLALGMAARRADIRAQAAELLAAAVPARISAADAAAGFAACAHTVALNRWASAFADAARIACATAVDVLAALLPRLDPQTRGLGALLTVLLDEATRLQRLPASPALTAWLQRFSGASASAKTARALRALAGGE
jgi:hypothetical protein